MITQNADQAHQPARASLPRVRERNLSVVIRAIFRSEQPPSRANVAAMTGLTKATTSRLVQELLHGGLIVELEPDEGQIGRKAIPLAPAPRSVVGIGLEVNVSYLAGRAMDLQGRTITSFKVAHDTVHTPPEETLKRVGELGTDLLRSLRRRRIPVAGARLAIPGPVSGGSLLSAPNLGWGPLEPLMHLGSAWLEACPNTVPENDAKLQALTVSRPRPGLLTDPISYLYLAGDIGIGSAFVLNGRFVQGEHGWAGELGHVCVDPDGPRCTCGAQGCLESLAGQAAIRRMAGLPPETQAQDIIDRLIAGDPNTVAAVATAARALGIAISAAINLFDVSQVVLGSGLSRLTRWLEPAIRHELDTRVLRAVDRGLAVLPGPEDETPATAGGALAVLESVLDDPAAALSYLACAYT